MWGLLAVGVIIMTIAANSVYSIWLGNRVVVPTILSILMGVYVLIIAWSNIFAYFMNGIGKIRLQLWLASIISVLNIPASIFLAKNLNMGIPGVILATCICLFPTCLIWPLQMKKILRDEAAGIWNK
jgi:Na+-driven multidrug efflux pump